MTPAPHPRTRLTLVALWLLFFCSFTLFTPPLLDDADSVHAEVAREILLRHDWVTLYANGIRYLEKAPLLYWSEAASMSLLGPTTAAARLPLALAVLALALLLEAFARRAFRSARAGLYAALIFLSSFGIFIFTRINIPDILVCLWLTLALFCFFLTENQPQVPHPSPTLAESGGSQPQVPHPSPTLAESGGSQPRVPHPSPTLAESGGSQPQVPHPSPTLAKGGVSGASPTALASSPPPLSLCLGFAAACALNILTKGLIGIVFPIAIVLLYLLLTRGPRATLTRLQQLHPLPSAAVFLLIALPWHLLIAHANPTQGHPGELNFTSGHWQVPLPTDGNVHGWAWFYFVNEQLLRYLNLRVPRDYDTVPLLLFYGLIFIWLLPWSAYLPPAITRALPSWHRLRTHTLTPRERTNLLLLLWAALPLLFFSLSTRQEYYVLPALPALILLVAHGLTTLEVRSRRLDLSATVLAALGLLAAAACTILLLHTKSPTPGTDLASLLQQHPGDYALSFGHFLDLNAAALGLFRLPLLLTTLSFGIGLPAAWYLRRRHNDHAATLTLAASAFLFLIAANLGLTTFAPTLTSAQLADTIRPQLHPTDLLAIHGEYEAGSSLGFYLRRNDLHLIEGRSSNLWYGSFFPDAPPIFETRESIAAKWPGPQRIFLWQDPRDPDRPPLQLPTPTYVIATSGGKQVLSNQPNR